MKHRCTGTVHGPPGDCLLPIVGALFCYGFLDRDEARPMADSLEGPVPLLFPVCGVHRVALVDWAQHLWGGVGDAVFLPPEGIPVALRSMRNQGETVVLSPNPLDAVAIVA